MENKELFLKEEKQYRIESLTKFEVLDEVFEVLNGEFDLQTAILEEEINKGSVFSERFMESYSIRSSLFDLRKAISKKFYDV
jgi:hypothetical protein